LQPGPHLGFQMKAVWADIREKLAHLDLAGIIHYPLGFHDLVMDTRHVVWRGFRIRHQGSGHQPQAEQQSHNGTQHAILLVVGFSRVTAKTAEMLPSAGREPPSGLPASW